jgi:hypothetical protein
MDPQTIFAILAHNFAEARIRQSSLVCCVDDPNAGQGAGGAGGGQGAGAGAALGQSTIDQINGVVRAAVRTMDIGKMVKDALATAMPEVVKTMTAEVSAALKPAEGGGEDKAKAKGGNGTDPELLNQFNALKAQVASLTEDSKAKDQALKAAVSRERDNSVAGVIRSRLEAAQITGPLAAGAEAVLKSKAKIQYTEDGKPYINVERTEYGTAYTERQTVEAFVDEWAKGDEGKAYRPAPGNRQQRQVGGQGGSQGQQRQDLGGGQRQQGSPGGQGGGQGNGRPQISDRSIGNALIEAYQSDAVTFSGDE